MMENKDAELDIYSGNSKPEQQRELVSSLEVGQLLEGRANKETSNTEAEGIVFLDNFRGDTGHLIAAMRALVEIDKEGCLRPHGIGGHASSLLVCSSIRLETLCTKVAELEAALREARDALNKSVGAMRGLYGGWRCEKSIKMAESSIVTINKVLGEKE